MKSSFKAAAICVAAILIVPAIWLGIGFSIRGASVIAADEYEPSVYEMTVRTNSGDEYTYYKLFQPDRVGEKFVVLFENNYTRDKSDDVIRWKI